MLRHGFMNIDLAGYVDTRGSLAEGIILSNARAESVRKYMSNKMLGAGVTIKSVGLAATQAVGDNSSALGQALNRRVEIRVR